MSENTNRTKWLHIRLTQSEYNKLQAGFSSSTKQKISSYARDLLLDKPVTVYTRNRSLDDFVSEMIGLRNELKSIGNNINQAVKKMHISTKDSDLKYWGQQIVNYRGILLEKIDNIHSIIASISDQWLQE